MTPRRIQYPEGANTLVVLFKTTTGAAAAISRQQFKIVCFANSTTGRLTMDKDATMGGRHIPNTQRRKMILVYKTSMHPESQLNSTPCGIKADPRTTYTWLIGTLRRLEQYPPTTSPPPRFNEDAEMKAEAADYNENKTEHGATSEQNQQPPHGDRGTQPQVEEHRKLAQQIPNTTVDRQTTSATHLRFNTPDPPTLPLKTRSGPATMNLGNTTTLHSRFSTLGENGGVSGEKDS